MLKKAKNFPIVFITIIITMFIMNPGKTVGETIKPGVIINSTNIEQHEQYFPSYMARYIKDGWGFEKPIIIHTREHEVLPVMRPYLEQSKKNIDTVKLNPDGTLSGYSMGFPFLEPKEPNKALKIMWNQFYRPIPDDYKIPENFLMLTKRKGGKVSVKQSIYDCLKFSNRSLLEPVPEIENPKDLLWTTILNFKSPPNKDMATLTWRYKDPHKHDEMWTYVPTLRRTIRLVSSERANPIQGTPQSWDDLFGFDGKILDFNYKLIGKQKILALGHANKSADDLPNGIWDHPIIYGEDEPYELLDTYIVEIKSKDPRYPESSRVVWIIKETFWVIYNETFDKAGKLWKGYFAGNQIRPIGNSELYTAQVGTGITDFKTGCWVLNYVGEMDMNLSLNPGSFMPGNLGTF